MAVWCGNLGNNLGLRTAAVIEDVDVIRRVLELHTSGV